MTIARRWRVSISLCPSPKKSPSCDGAISMVEFPLTDAGEDLHETSRRQGERESVMDSRLPDGCHSCGLGTIRPTGKTFYGHHKYTCDHCGFKSWGKYGASAVVALLLPLALIPSTATGLFTCVQTALQGGSVEGVGFLLFLLFIIVAIPADLIRMSQWRQLRRAAKYRETQARDYIAAQPAHDEKKGQNEEK